MYISNLYIIDNHYNFSFLTKFKNIFIMIINKINFYLKKFLNFLVMSIKLFKKLIIFKCPKIIK